MKTHLGKKPFSSVSYKRLIINNKYCAAVTDKVFRFFRIYLLRFIADREIYSERTPLSGLTADPSHAPRSRTTTPMTDITIYHNPRCGTSRNTLAMIRNSGAEPRVIEYLKTPPNREKLVELIAAAGLGVRGIMRAKEALFAELGLADPARSDDELIDAMMAHPILINRPIVVTPQGTRLCRPSEVVLGILPQPQRGAFTKEDGEKVVDAEGRRV